jgi:hypothetical protein
MQDGVQGLHDQLQAAHHHHARKRVWPTPGAPLAYVYPILLRCGFVVHMCYKLPIITTRGNNVYGPQTGVPAECFIAHVVVFVILFDQLQAAHHHHARKQRVRPTPGAIAGFFVAHVMLYAMLCVMLFD